MRKVVELCAALIVGVLITFIRMKAEYARLN